MLTLARSTGRFFCPNLKEIFLFTLSLLLAACGGGGGGGGTTVGGGGIGGTGAVGTVSAIGSVTVNGVTYSCLGAVVTNDDGTVDQGPGDNCIAARDAGRLSVGSVVVVAGNKDASGNFTASTVNISNNVFGPATNISVQGLSFTVLNQTILVDDATRFELNGTQSSGSAGLTTLANGATVEVSGFRNASGEILATLVETKTATGGEFELKGIATVSGSTVTIGGVGIVLNGQSPPSNGACVEAKGTWNGTNLSLTQALRTDDDCNGGSLSGNLVQAEVEGVINGFVSSAEFNIGSQKVTTNAATRYEGGAAADLLDGVKVEAEGTTLNGTLIATKVQIKSNGVRIEGVTDTALMGGTFTILGITVKVVTATDNDLGSSIPSNTRLRVEGSKSGATQVTAAKISNASGGGGGTRTELRGPLDADPVSPSFAILGVQVQTSGSTQFNGAASGSTAFFANTKKDQIVKARGTEATNNIITADEVENED
jgi:hypothetical protein